MQAFNSRRGNFDFINNLMHVSKPSHVSKMNSLNVCINTGNIIVLYDDKCNTDRIYDLVLSKQVTPDDK